MAKKSKKTPRRSFKQITFELETAKSELLSLRDEVSKYTYALGNRRNQIAITVDGYTAEKKPNALSVPEMIAIVGTAQKLGQKVELKISGVENGASLNVYFVEDVKVPYALSSI